MARRCEACQCLLSENGMMGNRRWVMAGQDSVRIPSAADQSDKRCQAELIHGQGDRGMLAVKGFHFESGL